MTYEEQLQYYADLLILQYRAKPKAQAMIQAIAREALVDNIALAIQDAFDLSNAEGVQLDVLGKYANVVRDVLTFTGGQDLSDDDFRTLIFVALARNSCKGSLFEIDTILKGFFGNALSAFDHQDMSMDYFFNSRIGSLPLAEAFVRLDLLPRPMGVTVSSLIYAPSLDNAFGFGSYTAPPFNVTGFQSYTDYDPTPGALPWLSYTDIITINF